MPAMGDYGTSDDPSLVPGSLTVFRHFYVDTAEGTITPMSYRPKQPDREGAYRDEASYRSIIQDNKKPYEKRPVGVDYVNYTAGCHRLTMLFNHNFGQTARGPHKSPDASCTCGFYAHYDPASDFYEETLWGRAYYGEMGFRWQNRYASLVVVRAAVEVSGTVVMGTLGVRAQRMRILAMAVDWDKHSGPVTPWPERPLGGLVPAPATPAPVEEVEAVALAVKGVAATYGVTYYDNADDMYADHPRSDVSALGVKEQSQAERELEAVREWIDRRARIQEKTDGVKFKQAILDKRNRSAPPGTGIDRRRGRLR